MHAILLNFNHLHGISLKYHILSKMNFCFKPVQYFRIKAKHLEEILQWFNFYR